MTYIYSLQNLTTDIKWQLEFFFAHIGMIPKQIISDFDTKLISGHARDYLNSLLVHVNAAPANRQDKNGLAKRHWQTMVSMARNWLTSAELPSSYWFYTVKRAAEVCNYFPYKLEDGSYTTPFELVHGVTEICLWRSFLVVKRNFCFPQPKSARLIIAFSVNLL
jgi:hypothetical protein